MSTFTGGPEYLDAITLGLPAIVDRAAYEAEIRELREREKALTRESDAIAAARRRLPMVEVDGTIEFTGPNGPVTLLDAFEGRRQLLVYTYMWYDGATAEQQCEGCTMCTTHVSELDYMHSRDITFAVIAQGSYAESARYHDFMGWPMPWYGAERTSPALQKLLGDRTIGMMHLLSFVRDGDRVFETWWTTDRGVEAMVTSYALIDLTVYGRQEAHEDSPPDWPKRPADWDGMRLNGRPSAQWSRLAAGRSDDLTGGEHDVAERHAGGGGCCMH